MGLRVPKRVKPFAPVQLDSQRRDDRRLDDEHGVLAVWMVVRRADGCPPSPQQRERRLVKLHDQMRHRPRIHMLISATHAVSSRLVEVEPADQRNLRT